MAVHHRRVKLVSVNLAIGRDQHVADHAQPLHMRIQRAQAVGELLGQHRDHAARKVNAGGAIVGVDVNGAAGLHIVAHIGNGHQQTPALAAPNACRFAINRIVKVAGVFAVDGHQGHIGEVNAVSFVLRPHFVRQTARQSQARLRKLMRHAVFAHGDFDFHAGVVHLAQHFFDASHGLSEQAGRFGQLDHHHLPHFGHTGGALGDQHILAIALVFWRHQPHAAFLQQTANDGLRRPLNDFNHTPFGAAAPIEAHHPGFDPVFVQDSAHFIGRQVNVCRPVITLYKAVAIAMALNGSFKFFQQAAGCAHFFDTIPFFPEMPRWRNW